MTDSIHPENEDITHGNVEDTVQTENEELNKSDIADSSDNDNNVQQVQTSSESDESYDECEDEQQTAESSGNDDSSENSDETQDEISETDEALEETESEAIEVFSKEDSGLISKIKHIFEKAVDAFLSMDKKKRKKYIIIYSIIALLILLILTDIIPILPNSYHRSYVGNQHTIADNGRSASASYRKGVIYANDGTVMCFGPDMNLETQIDTFSGSPLIRTSGDGAIVYSKNGNKALVMTSEKKKKVVNADEAIISASVNEKGDYVLVTKEAGYSACVSAFGYNSKAIYKWHTGNNILDTAISPNAQNIVASTIEYSDTQLYSKLVFLDVASKDPIMQIDLDANLAVELVFLDKNTIVAIGDSYTTAYTPQGNQKWRIDYDGKLLKTYDISDDGTIAFLFKRYNSAMSESFVEIYNSRGRKIGDYQNTENVRNISYNNKHCLLILDDGTVLIDSDGDVKKRKKLTKEYFDLELYQNYNFAFGSSNGFVEIVSVRH